MKKVLLASIIISIIFSVIPDFSITANAASVKYYATSLDGVKLRNEIGKEKEVVSHISKKGTVFRVIETQNHKVAVGYRIWHKIEISAEYTDNGCGGVFWLWNGNVTEHKKHDMKDSVCQTYGCSYHEPVSYLDGNHRQLQVKTETVAIRRYPYYGGKELDRLQRGSPISVVGAVMNSKNHKWYIVENNAGYVYSEYVTVLSEEKNNALDNSINNAGGNSNGVGAGFGNIKYYTPPVVEYQCKHSSWSVGKCVNCGEKWILKEKPVNGTYVANADNVGALDIPYREGTVKKRYSKGEYIPIVAKAENSALHYWYKTSDGYWVYGVENANLQRAALAISGHTFYSKNETYTPNVVLTPPNAVVKKTWSVVDEKGKNVAIVDSSTGKITPKGPGRTKMICTVQAQEGTVKTLEFDVKVPESTYLEPWEYDNQKYNSKLALECVEYCALAYPEVGWRFDGDKVVLTKAEKTFEPLGLTSLLKHRKFDYKVSNNYYDKTEKNSPFTLASKRVKYNGNENGKDVVYVIIEGSAGKPGWQGNMKMAGDGNYYKNLDYHYTFNTSAEDIKKQLEAYINENNIKKPIVVITGHSRGAAAGNILAADITNDTKYEKVYAYLFATPNVTKKPNNSLKNIINVCNELDFVTYIPFSSKWNFKKNGQTYSFDSASLYKTSSTFADVILREYGQPDYNWQAMTLTQARAYASGKWKDVKSYYESEVTYLKVDPASATSVKIVKEGTPFNYFYNGLALAACEEGGVGEIFQHVLHVCDFTPLSSFFVTNGAGVLSDKLTAFKACHTIETYHAAVYAEVYGGVRLNQGNASLFSSQIYGNGDVEINGDEYDALLSFFRQKENELMLEVAGWDIEDASTWEGVKWYADGHVISIDLSYLDLSGWFNANSFPYLQDLNIDGNDISMLAVSECSELVNLSCMANNIGSLAVNNCEDLQNLNCGFNQISSLDVSNMSQLVNLNCYGNQISDLELSGATALQTLRCGSNELHTIDVSTNTSLNTFYCDNNNIAESQNAGLINSINTINANGGAAILGVQKYNENYDFNASELSYLTEFANMSLNLEKLGWDLENPYTWQGVEWKIIGDEYHITAIDFDGLGLEGDFHLPDARYVESVSCENSSLTAINLTGCSALNTLNCYNSGISSLEFDNCSSLVDVNCNENYLEVEDVESSLNQIGLSTGIANYDTQNIDEGEEKFNLHEREELISFMGGGVNAEILGWDWDWPGSWDGIVWTKVDDEYRVNKIDFSDKAVCGDIDLSAFDYLEEFDFSGSQIEKVVLPNCITTIPENAFYNSSIRYIHMGEGVTNIEESAFAYCDNLNTVVLPSTVTRIMDNAFYMSENLKNLVFIGDEPLFTGKEIAYGTSPDFQILFFADSEWNGETELMNDYSCVCAGNEFIVLLDETIELKDASYYNETNNYAGDDINVTVVSRTPGENAVCCLSVYDEFGRLNEFNSLPIKINGYMTVADFEDINIQYVGEEYCTLKAFLWKGLNSLKPLTVPTEKFLIKSISE